MFNLIKTIISLLLTSCFTYLFYKDFYSDSLSLLNIILIFSSVIALFINLPQTKRKLTAIILMFVPFILVYAFTYNFVFSIGALFISVLIGILTPQSKTFTKILFTDNNECVVIKHYKKKTFGTSLSLCRSVFASLMVLIFTLGLIFPTPSPIWLVRAFPVDFSEKEVFEGDVIPSGLVTSTAWYDDNALLVADFFDIDPQTPSPGKSAGLRVGDAIVKINGERALSSSFIQNGPDGNPVLLTVERGDEEGNLIRCEISVTPVYSESEGKYLIGINYYSAATLTASVQTLSFSYPDTGYFAATAHSSDDVYEEIGHLKGILLKSTATGRDEAGLTAIPESAIGHVLYTNNYGCYGILANNEGNAVPLGKKKDVHLGKATLISAFEGGEPTEYEVYVVGTYRIDLRDIIYLIVTDERIVKAGGITRGMSGSPIIQDGKLIGALSNMDRGGFTAYATYAYDMAHEIYINSDKLTIDKEG